MTTHMKNSLVPIVILMGGLPVTWASAPNDPNVILTFEVQPPLTRPLSLDYMRRRGGKYDVFASLRPAHAAAIPLSEPGPYLVSPAWRNLRDFVSFVLRREGLSAAQKDFLDTTEGLLHDRKWVLYYPDPDDHPRDVRLLLYAMTLEDAKEMAEAHVQFAMEGWHRDVEERKERIKGSEQSIAAVEERMRELEKVIESSEQALNSLKHKVPYRTEKEAMEAIAELDRMLNAALVDIAGIQSRIRAIQDHLRTGKSPYDEAIKAKLQGMFVEESVALQGAESRKAMATQLRADANHFLDLKESRANAAEEKEKLPTQMAAFRSAIAKARASLETVRAQKPQIADRTIAIYPVEWTAEDEGN